MNNDKQQGLLLGHKDYVEMVCYDEKGAYEINPSVYDVKKNSLRFMDPCKYQQGNWDGSVEDDIKAFMRWGDYRNYRHNLFGDIRYLDNCTYCNSQLFKSPLLSSEMCLSNEYVSYCNNCGWWETEEIFYENKQRKSTRSIRRRSILKEFFIAGIDIPIDELRKYLCKYPDKFYSVNPHVLEKLVGSIFGDYMDCEVSYIGGPNDGGIDLILINGERKYAVQVKRRGCQNVAEKVSSIREFVGAMVINESLQGIFVTTADRFSPAASKTAQQAIEKTSIEYLELVDSKKLIEICNLTASNLKENWENAFCRSVNIIDHVNEGHLEFYDSYMNSLIGNTDWKYDPLNPK